MYYQNIYTYMKNKLIIVLISLVFVVPSASYAIISTNSQNVVTDIDPESSIACADLTRNLRYGMKDTEMNANVSMLQDFLFEKGFLKATPTGFFGRATVNAVIAFQKANGIVASSFVGPLTRAKIKEIDCKKEEVVQLIVEKDPRFVGEGCKIASGCNGKMYCVKSSDNDSVTSICDARPEYACYRLETNRCEKQLTGECGWTQTSELMSCIDKARNQ